MPGCFTLSTLSAVSRPVVRAMLPALRALTHNYTHDCVADYGEEWRTCKEEQRARNPISTRDFLTGSEWWRRTTDERDLRKGWDSNPRGACTPGGFQDRCLNPLGHPSL